MNVNNWGRVVGSGQNSIADIHQPEIDQKNTRGKAKRTSRLGRAITRTKPYGRTYLNATGKGYNRQSRVQRYGGVLTTRLSALKVTQTARFPSLKNWGSTCWFNASMVLMMNMLDHMDSKQWQIVYSGQQTHSDKEIMKEAFLVAMAEFHHHFQAMFCGDMPGCSLEFQQRALMLSLHQLAHHQPEHSLKALFPKAIPIQQQDAAHFLYELMALMNMPNNPEFTIAMGAEIIGYYQGKMLKRYTDASPSSIVNIKIPLPPTVQAADGGQADGKQAGNEQVGSLALGDCIKACLDGTEGSFDWSREDLARVGITSAGLSLQGSTRNFWQADLQKLRSFTIVMDMFEFQNGQGIKRAEHAMEVFMGNSRTIQLPVHDREGQCCTLYGQIKALICHHGDTPDNGHYIALSFRSDKIIVHDDSTVMPLHDYLDCKTSVDIDTREWSYQDFLMNFGFTPYIATYDRVTG